MATRRPQSQTPSPETEPEKTNSDVTPAVPGDVIIKLLSFTAAMIIMPIGMYFLTVESIFKGSATYAGITAAVTANIILFAYIYVAWRDDQGEREGLGREREKKGQ